MVSFHFYPQYSSLAVVASLLRRGRCYYGGVGWRSRVFQHWWTRKKSEIIVLCHSGPAPSAG